MDATRQIIFDRLQAAMRTRKYSLADIFETFGSFAVEYPPVAQAFAAHAKDIIAEQQSTQDDHSDFLAEVYRRTFFDPAMDGKVGTHCVIQDIGKLGAFADYIIASFPMDDAQQHAGSFHDAPKSRQ